MIPVINYLAVIVAAIASIAIGFAWYGPLFGKPWMKIMGFSKDSMTKAQKDSMMKNYILMTIGTLVTAYVLAHTTEFGMSYTRTYGVAGGLMSGFWVWLGFMAPIHMGDQLWGGKPWKLFAITAGYSLVSILVMGVILATWR
ncbi:DUF1761 domain-containing protein [Patescibacteria group bacterium]|jgi:hypothetical protein|nr:DUF1761 domain-containing protein [Patescibacteria group bacterium]